MRLRSMILAIGACSMASIAHAQPFQGFYLGAGAGARIPFSTKATSLTPGTDGAFNIKQQLGYDAELSVGYALGDGWRFELEGMLGRSNVKGVSSTRFPATATGAIRNRGVMANALFDLDVGSPYIFPYFGLGMGYQSTSVDNFTLSRTDKAYGFRSNGEAGQFAAQAIGGVSFPIRDMPGLSLVADYRITDILGGGKFGNQVSPGALSTPGSIKLHNQFNQDVIIGLRFAFGVAPPAAPASTK